MKYVCHFVKRGNTIKKKKTKKRFISLPPGLKMARVSSSCICFLSFNGSSMCWPDGLFRRHTQPKTKKEERKKRKTSLFFFVVGKSSSYPSTERLWKTPAPCFEAADVCAMWDAENASVQSLFFFFFFFLRFSLTWLSVCCSCLVFITGHIWKWKKRASFLSGSAVRFVVRVTTTWMTSCIHQSAYISCKPGLCRFSAGVFSLSGRFFLIFFFW